MTPDMDLSRDPFLSSYDDWDYSGIDALRNMPAVFDRGNLDIGIFMGTRVTIQEKLRIGNQTYLVNVVYENGYYSGTGFETLGSPIDNYVKEYDKESVSVPNHGMPGIGSYIRNGLIGMGGTFQIIAGVSLCSTGLGCALGAPLIAVGVTNIGESITGLMNPSGEGFNMLQGALQVVGLSERNAVAMNGIFNLSLDLVALNMPNLAARTPEFIVRHSGRFEYVIDIVRYKDELTRTGIASQALFSGVTTFNSISNIEGR